MSALGWVGLYLGLLALFCAAWCLTGAVYDRILRRRVAKARARRAGFVTLNTPPAKPRRRAHRSGIRSPQR